MKRTLGEAIRLYHTVRASHFDLPLAAALLDSLDTYGDSSEVDSDDFVTCMEEVEEYLYYSYGVTATNLK